MSRRMWVLGVLAWVGVVIAGSALTWLAINQAGDQVSDAADAEATQPVVVSTVDPAPSTRPTRPRTRKPIPSPAAPASRYPTPSPTPAPATEAQPAPSPPRATARTETRTWTGTAGFVTVSCSAGLARLQAASPNDGWSVERGDEVGDHAEVRFDRGDSEVQVQAGCDRGVPTFEVQTGGERTGDR